jgi:hypothetical protein
MHAEVRAWRPLREASVPLSQHIAWEARLFVPATPVLDAGVPIPRGCEYEMMQTTVVISTLVLAIRTRDLDNATLRV